MRNKPALNEAQAKECCQRFLEGALVTQLSIDYTTSIPTIYKYLRRGGVMKGRILRTKVSNRAYHEICRLALASHISVEQWLLACIVDALADEGLHGLQRSEPKGHKGRREEGQGERTPL